MNKTTRAILLSVGIILFILMLWYIRAVIAYVLISVVLSILGRPLVGHLEKKKIFGKPFPTSLAAVCTLIVIVAVFAGVIGMFIPLVQEEAAVISSIDESQFRTSLQEPLSDLGDKLESQGLLPEGSSKESFVKKTSRDFLGMVDISGLFNYFLSKLGSMIIAIMSILFITFFMLKDRTLFLRAIYSVTPERNLDKTKQVLINVKETLTRYFYGICLQILIITTLVSIGLLFLDVKHAILIGFIAGLLNVIPYLGPILGGFIGVMIGVTGSLELDFYTETVPYLIKIVAVFGVVQMIDAFVLQPYIFSSSVNAHPLEIFLVILTAGTIAGIPGMLLAVPTYSVLRIIASEFYSQFTFVQSMTKRMNEQRSEKNPIDGIRDHFKKKKSGPSRPQDSSE